MAMSNDYKPRPGSSNGRLNLVLPIIQMDKLAELEEKKRQLKELKERRLNGRGGSLVDKLLQGVQQDERRLNRTLEPSPVLTAASKEVSSTAATRNVITYDKVVQTTPTNLDEPPNGEDKCQDKPQRPSSSSPLEETGGIVLPPALIAGDQNTVKIKSFSLQEVLNDSFPRDKKLLDGQSKSGILPLLSFSAGLEQRPGTDSRPVSLDNLGNLVVMIIKSVPIDRYNVLMTPWSYLILFKWDAKQRIDKIEFRGQTMTSARFLRKDVTSNVISILVTSHTGKTILVELQCVEGSNSSAKLERNLISRNVFVSAVPALAEYHNVPPGHERFIAASSSGLLNELSSLDLSFYADATSSDPPLSNVKVIPPRPSELVVLGDNEDDEEETQASLPHNAGEMMLRRHLLKLSLFDALAISAIALSPSDSRCVYVGTEDGGIYKLNLDKAKDGKLKILPSNNGFLPVKGNTAASDDTLPLFHSSHVTALSHNRDELLLSASLDWTCALWDPFNNSKLAMLDMGSPIIDAAWLENENHLCAVLTWDALSIIEWQYHSITDTDTLTDYWQATTLPRIIYKLSAKEASCGSFICFKNFKQDGLHHIFAVGCDDQEVRFYKMALRS